MYLLIKYFSNLNCNLSLFFTTAFLKKAFENALSLLLLFFDKTCANESGVFHQNWVHLIWFLTNVRSTKKRKCILMNCFMFIFLNQIVLFLFLTIALPWDRNLLTAQDVNLQGSCESSKAADLYQLSVWPIVYNTASRRTSDAPSSPFGNVSFSCASWVFSLLAKPLMLQKI